ncbi:MAG: formylglycine-generating enzyme family protein [Bdellovibrionales bacterium]|nr:formylglycine-generating enzyme family protein [Bdellovibrionales bacterium]
MDLLKWLLIVLNTLISYHFIHAEEIKLVKVPSGVLQPFWLTTFVQGSPKKKAPDIKIVSFQAMRTQVSVAQFKKFLETHPEWRKDQAARLFVDNSYLRNIDDTEINQEAPITWVSWFAAREYCKSFNMRLPTTNEWEYMAQASEVKRNASKDQKFLDRILTWYGQPQTEHLASVYSGYKNIYGIWNLHGLVWEWVEDFNSSFVTGESRADTSLNKNLFCGAGALNSADHENYAAFMRFAFRSSLKGKTAIWNLGFRCVK